jgi:hypothetical protein
MQTPLQIAKKLTVTPLLDIHNAEFAKHYSSGVWWGLFGEMEDDGPLADRYLVDNLTRNAEKGYFDGLHNDWLPFIGFYIGVIHAGVLSRQGILRSDITTHVTFTDLECAHGYHIGRRDHLYYHDPPTLPLSDSALLRELCETAHDLQQFPDDDGSGWYYSEGCLLGAFSATLFPATNQGWQ